MTEKGIFRAAVPSGASTGVHEALELRDKEEGWWVVFLSFSFTFFFTFTSLPVSRILHHIHPCLIEAIMRHIIDKYEAIMGPPPEHLHTFPLEQAKPRGEERCGYCCISCSCCCQAQWLRLFL